MDKSNEAKNPYQVEIDKIRLAYKHMRECHYPLGMKSEIELEDYGARADARIAQLEERMIQAGHKPQYR